MSRRRRSGRRRSFEKEDVNPMNGISNLSDAMLILAVGILLALIVHWNVDISTSGGNMSDTGMSVAGNVGGEGGDAFVDSNKALEFEQEALEHVNADEAADGEGMEELGMVYYDAATGKYYIIPGESK